MALLFFDGFEAGDYALKWRATGTITLQSPGRFGAGSYLRLSGNNYIAHDFASAANKVYVGVAMGCTTIDTSNRVQLQLLGDTGATMHLMVTLVPNGIRLYRGATQIGSYTTTINASQLYYIEMSATINDTTGTCQVRYNGQLVIDFTGDTKNGGTNNTIDTLILIANGSVQPIFDDFYLCDDTGAAPHNNFLGDIRVQTIVPNGAGSSTQFTPSSGANYTNVDELPYSAGDYVSSSTTGHRDMYTMSDISNTTTIYGVQNNVIAKKTDASALSLRPAVKSGPTLSYGSSVVLSASDVLIRNVRTVDPDTSVAWTQSGVNALEAGFEVV